MMPTGPLSWIGVAAVAALVMATLIGQRLGRMRWARVFAIVAIGVTAYSTNQIHSRRLADQPFPDAQEVTEVTWRMVHGQGYTITLHGTGPLPPRYAPGYPIALAPFALVGREFPGRIPRGAAFYAALYVVAVCLAAWTMGGPAAGALAALVVGISPFAREMARMVMSDAFAAALTMLLIPLLHKPTRNRALWAGLLAGSLVAVRLPMVLNLAALVVALPRSLWSRAILAATIPLAAYAAFNHFTYGGPFTTGYHHWVHCEKLQSRLRHHCNDEGRRRNHSGRPGRADRKTDRSPSVIRLVFRWSTERFSQPYFLSGRTRWSVLGLHTAVSQLTRPVELLAE